MKRLEAIGSLIKNDERGGALGNMLVKAHDVYASVVPAIISPLDKGNYEVVRDDGVVAGLRANFHNAMYARWAGTKGHFHPVNLLAKGVEAVANTPDAVVSDILHVGGLNRHVVRVRP